ncbi:maleylpyruvate isomerase N-terminal domain-containing protein [Saxibacter everestensis]|uniref:Maleylpyruvate isomerase N-terminal domain-containing protein n=1 Tax=Saxibacter everestensis TaxID=2909229 RepID=A0ABY8QT66_9MICO|nr:maleylpyruvate isomerase N-terminal domain-containing protein [Brevibacteriaceae bacterium ZFBP1038]
MEAFSVEHDRARAIFREQLKQFVTTCSGLSDRDLLVTSRCHGWAVLDVVTHVRAGLEEMLGGFVAPTNRAANRDAASYWGEFPPGNGGDGVDGILWTRRTASAYRRPSGATDHLQAAASAVARAADGLAEGAIESQGYVLRSGDFLATWAVELAIHHLDMMQELQIEGPTPRSLELTRATISALLEAELPTSWDDTTCVLLGTGREAPKAKQAAELDRLGLSLPVLG